MDSAVDLIIVYTEQAKWVEPAMALAMCNEVDRLYQQIVPLSHTIRRENGLAESIEHTSTVVAARTNDIPIPPSSLAAAEAALQSASPQYNLDSSNSPNPSTEPPAPM